MIIGTYGRPMTITCRDEDGDLVDMEEASSVVLNYKAPSGTLTPKDGTVAARGKVQYTIEDGFINEPGEWTVQVVVTFTDSKIIFDQVSFSANSPLA